MSDPAAFTRSRNATSFVGMAIFMGGWSMMLLALLFAYADVRLHASAWPPEGEPRLPLSLPALATLILVVASIMIERARRMVKPDIRAVIMLLLGFLLAQAIVWRELFIAGLHASSQLGAVFWLLTIFHAVHIAIAIIGLGTMYTYNASDWRFRPRLRNWAIFQHGLLAAWLIIFVTVYLV